MTPRRRYPLHEGIRVGAQLLEALSPACDRILVVGSVRRRKETVGDVEIAFVPRYAVVTDASDLFGLPVRRNTVEPILHALIRDGIIEKRTGADGTFVGWGALNKFAIHKETRMPIDLFAEPDARCFWRTVVIRTGGQLTNLRLTASARKLNRCLHASGDRCCEDLATGTVSFPADEAGVFDFCRCVYQCPEARD